MWWKALEYGARMLSQQRGRGLREEGEVLLGRVGFKYYMHWG